MGLSESMDFANAVGLNVLSFPDRNALHIVLLASGYRRMRAARELCDGLACLTLTWAASSCLL
jgi:hypothetical protein